MIGVLAKGRNIHTNMQLTQHAREVEKGKDTMLTAFT